jgi:hypothetical protein
MSSFRRAEMKPVLSLQIPPWCDMLRGLQISFRISVQSSIRPGRLSMVQMSAMWGSSIPHLAERDDYFISGLLLFKRVNNRLEHFEAQQTTFLARRRQTHSK